MQTVKTGNLLSRAWELRHNVSAYDGCYLALAELLGARVVTGDEGLSKAPGLAVTITLV